MIHITHSERDTQNRVIDLFRNQLGYTHLGNWSNRPDNSNIEDDLLTAYLQDAGYSHDHITRALHTLHTEAGNPNRSRLENNMAVYNLLRYGIHVKRAAGEMTDTVKPVDWDAPERNHFAIAEEVTLRGNHERRPDLVLYLNGIAIAVIELKNSRTDIGKAIRQLISNQTDTFNGWFFATAQILFAGNDSEGLRYGTVGTPEAYYLRWKEDEHENTGYKLDKYLAKMCAKDRLLEVIHDFVLFDGGVKKLPRAHQYFGVKAAQERLNRFEGGILWHTQGSGKSILMVLLAKWLLETKPNARVVIITDRDELDKQIERVFTTAGETIQRARSRRDLMEQLGLARPRLLCSLVHKFAPQDTGSRLTDAEFAAYIRDLQTHPSPAVGELFLFVDECHRTQSGRLHKVMKALLPSAVFVGFTGTPLLKRDKQTSLEVFGKYIHTYLFSEGVEDGVILDLMYESRDIDQRISSGTRIDQWFDARTKGLNDWQKAALRERWGTMRAVLSSKSRMQQVVNDILLDFEIKPRLSNARGNAMLVAGSIHEACRYYTLFEDTPFKGKCAVITSYNPNATDITLEDTGANSETDKQFIYNLYTRLLEGITPRSNMTRTETYEENAKSLFIREPANMKLLIVVDKLLTGFDAPSCTYLYIDKSMQDHGLFQAICRTNRLDGDDKDFGYIVDYKDLFKKVGRAIRAYTSEIDTEGTDGDPDIVLKDRLREGRERLENAREALGCLCEKVEPPKGDLEHIHYFCGNSEIPEDLQETEVQRVALYKGVSSLVRAFANISDELEEAGYTTAQAAALRREVEDYVALRDMIKHVAGETLDVKPYEADMRHLIDSFIEADPPKVKSSFENLSILQLIESEGLGEALNTLPDSLKGNKEAVAETIVNNVRRTIIKEHLNDPAYYDRMSALLDELIASRRRTAIKYEEYLRRIAELAKQVLAGKAADTPKELDSPGKRALYSNLAASMPDSTDQERLSLAIQIDKTVRKVCPDGWRGHTPREQVVKEALYGILQDQQQVERIFPILKAQKEY